MKILKDLKCYKHAPTIVKSRRRRRRKGRRAGEFVHVSILVLRVLIMFIQES
jgi:hypothetical protein